ncbi:hypothetical protein HF078_09230 [Bacillus sp. RO2]|uniref:hypothetical protein n=1 Tax=Bacillus sp. RO2 TaxID=2723913 RepID=UPI00145D6185|nr:hypothetical protein [Bacillus sp. RO2]NMH73254.1 hypothetical protein [Bacillus sp. RO2]
MHTWKYKTTNDFFEYLDFHDCVVEKTIVEKGTVIIDFEFVYVSPDHHLNPYGVAKSTDRCRLTFNEVTDSHCIIHFGDGTEKQVLITDLEEMEFLQFNQKPLDSYIIFEMFGTDWRTHQFCSIQIKAISFTLEWNDFTEDAWYVKKQK